MTATHTVFKDRMEETFKEKSDMLASMNKKTPKSLSNGDYNSEGVQLGHRRIQAVM